MTQVPRIADAILDDRKITQYLLSTVHPTAGMLGRTQERIAGPSANNPVTSQANGPFSQKFEVSCSLAAPDGRNPCIISHG